MYYRVFSVNYIKSATRLGASFKLNTVTVAATVKKVCCRKVVLAGSLMPALTTAQLLRCTAALQQQMLMSHMCAARDAMG